MDLRSTELHGLSAFALEDGIVYHTYSCYDRGTDVLNPTWQLSTARHMDVTPAQRAGRAAAPMSSPPAPSPPASNPDRTLPAFGVRPFSAASRRWARR
jgi:Bacterial protein of unknown function (DUF899)